MDNAKETKNGLDDDGNGYIDDVQGVDIVTGRGSGEDENGHGTHVAGIIGARGNNDRGISGLCWKVKIVNVRILDAEGRGYVSQQVAGIEYALRAGAKVINCSFGGPDSSDVMRDAIAEARKQGALIVAAAGNDGVDTDKTPFYPAAYPDSNVLSVAATDDRDKLASFSNYGAKTVDLAAPGDAVGSTYLEVGLPLPVRDQHGGAVRRGGRGHAARVQVLLGHRRHQLAGCARRATSCRRCGARPRSASGSTSTARSVEPDAALRAAARRPRRPRAPGVRDPSGGAVRAGGVR